jgi:cytosolic phospholipase A2
MKKKIIILIVTLSTAINPAPPLRDIPNEFENYHTDRWPQFLIDFYGSIKETLHEVKENLSSIPESLYQTFIGQNPHYREIAEIRYTETDDICNQEKDYVTNRLSCVKKNLEQLLNISLEEDKIPKIGFVFSGGGFRSMLTTLGFLCGAEHIGLLDSTLYCVGLSGSTWALAPWVASGKPLSEFIMHLTSKLTDGIDHINDPYELSELLQIFITKILCRQLISTMDIYGGLIANTLLKGFVKNPMLIKLSESHASIKNGSLPMPIYTAIQSNLDPYEWMEFTPFEIGSSFFKSYIPTWAYGRKFKYGVSIDQAPEQTLGYYLGVFGSAFEVNLKDIVRLTADNLSYYGHQLPSILAQALKKCLQLILASFIGDVRLFPSMLANFTYLYQNSPVRDDKTISLIDAGINFNLPFPPLLRPARNIDIIIVYDASSNIEGASDLRQAEKYAKRNGLKFPPINYEAIDKTLISVFRNINDPEIPVVIYFPRIKNLNYSEVFDPDHCVEYDYCHTFNFAYKPEEAKLLAGFAEFTIKEHQAIVKQVIEDVLVHKYGYNINSNEAVSEALLA